MTDQSGREKYTAQTFIDAIPGSAGIITTIAKRVGCDWHTAKKYIYGHSTVLEAYEDECQGMGDLAEVELYKLIKSGDLGAIKFYLATKMKARGYVERTEVTGKDGGPLELQWADGTAVE